MGLQPRGQSFVKRSIRIAPQRWSILSWVVILLAVGAFIAAIVMPLWLPRTIRRIIPDRYIAAYAPEPLQAIIFESQSPAILPTALVSHENSNNLLGNTPTSVSQSPTPSASVNTGTRLPDSALPSPTPLLHATSTVPPTEAVALPTSFRLSGLTHIYQGWNNCGPATLTSTLSYWGTGSTQREIADFVKPNPEDRNVRPDELAAYVESIGLRMIVRINGNLELLKRLIADGYPVMIEQGFEVEGKGWMGHYAVLFGYSDEKQIFTSMDSYQGANFPYSYAHIEQFWPQFNKTYLVVYSPDQASEIASLIGGDINDVAMVTNALQSTQQQLSQNPDDAYGWFNLGSDMVALSDYENAAIAYDRAREIGLPWRMLWYQFGPYQAYLNIGRYDDIHLLADRVLADNVYSEESYYYKGLAYVASGDPERARRYFEAALLYNKHYTTAQTALNALAQ
jgi:hypothetical protein